MANGHLVADDQRMGIVSDMEHAEVLHVRPVADSDAVHVPANDSMEPDATVFAQHDITNDDAGFFDKAGCRDGWLDTLKCADHASHCRGIGQRSARGAAHREIAPRRVPCEAYLVHVFQVSSCSWFVSDC